ncbi:MAG: DNA adenine methylase [bacterium]
MQEKNNQLHAIIKWAGGKEKELKYILPNSPQNIESYFEPFVGGGSVYTSILADKYFINDKSDELINFYSKISSNDKLFFYYINEITLAWSKMLSYAEKQNHLVDYYIDFRCNRITINEFNREIEDNTNSNSAFFNTIFDKKDIWQTNLLVPEVIKNLTRKVSRMYKIELSKGEMPIKDIKDNINTAYMSALYMHLRTLYNDKVLLEKNKELASALFMFIRNYSYSGMFRYNDKGEFNVPFGGIGYNKKSLSKKINYYKSEKLSSLFSKTKIENLDFEDFLKKYNPNENDFIFLDPPYDSEFSTYAQNIFDKSDQIRLSKYLINECKSKWMMIIKNTPFILSLYENSGLNIDIFDKKYLVSFMNRNNKSAEHLLIRNY